MDIIHPIEEGGLYYCTICTKCPQNALYSYPLVFDSVAILPFE